MNWLVEGWCSPTEADQRSCRYGDPTSSFIDNGAINKGIKNVIGRGGPDIGRIHIGHF